jgi:hypothetical protein
VKHCDKYSRLIEMVLPIEVKENTQPKFEFEPQSIFEL